MRQSNILNSTGLHGKPAAAQLKEAASIVYRIAESLEILDNVAESLAGGPCGLAKWRRAAGCVNEILRQVDCLLREVDFIGYSVDAFNTSVTHRVMREETK